MLGSRRTWGAISALTLLATTGLIGCGSNTGTVAAQNDAAIIGGQEATNQVYDASIVALYNTAEGSLCTASLLSQSIAVTAAHCVGGQPSDLIVLFVKNINEKNPTVRQVSAYKTSPIWASRQSELTNNGDIAIVKFDGGLPAGYQPIQMLNKVSALSTGMTMTLAGFGTSDGVHGTGAGVLRFVDVTVQDANYSKSEILIDQTHGKGACHGDSGGPAYIQVNGQYLLAGVTSRGVNDPKNDCSVASAYTSVAYYTSWITRTAKELNKKAVNTPNNVKNVPTVAAN